jgi:hypothetical protein
MTMFTRLGGGHFNNFAWTRLEQKWHKISNQNATYKDENRNEMSQQSNIAKKKRLVLENTFKLYPFRLW